MSVPPRGGPGRRMGCGGQIAIPFLFALPSLLLFVYLLYETTRLSREKIRHQFALDSAAFVEMNSYSDFLNRAAYINGAFPMRLFHEAFGKVCIERKSSGFGSFGDCGPFKERLYDILAKNGAFPTVAGFGDMEDTEREMDGKRVWDLRFGGCGEAKNSRNPDLDTCGSQSGELELLTLKDAKDYWLTWNDAQDIYRLYVQVYQLLGETLDSQYELLRRVTQNRILYRKAYWLNTNASLREADGGADWFNRGGARVGSDFRPRPHCIESVMIYGTRPATAKKNPYLAAQVFKPDQAASMGTLDTIADCQPTSGLFQLMAIAPGDVRNLRAVHAESNWPGLPVLQRWISPDSPVVSNAFRVDFRRLGPCQAGGSAPCVHATVAVVNPAQSDVSWSEYNGLWPNPTPKFQTRMYP